MDSTRTRRAAWRTPSTLSLCTSLWLTGCTGILPTFGETEAGEEGEHGARGDGEDDLPDDALPLPPDQVDDDPQKPAEVADCDTPGPRLVRRLTAAQYRNTLVDLFEDTNVPAQEVLADPVKLGFHIDADESVVRDLGVEQLLNYTEKVAAWAVTNKLERLSECRDQTPDCRKRFLESFGRRAFREPVTSEQLAAYDALFARESSFEAGLTTTLSAMLMSPNLLFRRELGVAEGGLYALSAHEIASELSYLTTDSMPDAELRAAADSGALRDPAEVERQAARLLASERGRATLTHFLEGWLEVDRLRVVVKDETTTQFPKELREDMLSEADLLFRDVFDTEGTLATLLGADHSFMNRRLSEFYGVNRAYGETLERVDLTDEARRAPGILGTGAFLASHASSDAPSPVKRGVIVRQRLLCEVLLPPPSDVDTNLEPPPANVTNRERYKAHSENPRCAACHQMMDPIGFTFEHFDAFGRYQETDKGLAIDDSGALNFMPEGDVPLEGASDLISYLADAEAVEACLVRFWSYYAYGRDTWNDKACTHGAVLDAASERGGSLREVFLGLLRAPHFTRRVQDL